MNSSYEEGGATPLVRIDHVSRTYPDGGVTALVDVSFEIRRGEYVAIMGPSGSGKSTLLNLLGALDRPTAGEIYFEDQPLSKLRDLDGFRSKKIGFVFQSFYLLPTLTAVENVQIPMFEGPLSSSARASRRVNCSIPCEWGIGLRICRCNCRWANANEWPSRGPWRMNRKSCSPTNRPATSIPNRAPASSTCSTIYTVSGE